MNVRNRVFKGWRPVPERQARGRELHKQARSGEVHSLTARMWRSMPNEIEEQGLNPQDFGWRAEGSMGWYEAPLGLMLEAHGMLVQAMTEAGAVGVDEVAECALAMWMHENERCGCYERADGPEKWQDCEWRGYGVEDAVLVIGTHVSEVPAGVAPEEHTYGDQRVVLHRWYDVCLALAKQRRDYEDSMDRGGVGC